MYKTVIYLLVLYLTSARGRVAVNDKQLPDIYSNVIPHVAKTNLSVIEIELPTFKSNDVLEHDQKESVTTVTTLKESTTKESTSENPSVNTIPTDDQEESVSTVTTAKPEGSTTKESITTNTTENSKVHTIPTVEKHEQDNKIDTSSEEDEENIFVDVGVALSLTPMLENKQFEAARNVSKVDPELFMGIESYAAYFTVNKTYDSNLFFWYFPVENKPVNETPWIIWLQGGPGASSMTGLFDEIGPFGVSQFNGELVRKPFTWLKDHSLLFIDNPVGTGFSYTNNPEGYTTDMETYGIHLWSTLEQFLQVFPELRSAPLYIAGESYAGKYVPALAMHVHQNKGQANLQGLITGNAYVDPAMISQITRPFYYFGLMDMEQIELIKPLTEAFQKDIEQKNSVAAKEKWNNIITVLLLLTNQQHAYNFLRDELTVGRYLGFLNKPEIKRALHVGDIHFSHVNMTVNVKLSGEFLSSAKDKYEELLNHYRVLTYCGQLDQMLSCVMTSENYRTWQWNGSKEFSDAVRYPYIYNNRVAGYHKTGGNLTEVVIRGAGHMAAVDAPAPLHALVARWTRAHGLGRVGLLAGSFVRDYVRNNRITNKRSSHGLEDDCEF